MNILIDIADVKPKLVHFSKSSGKRPKTYKGSRDGFQKLNDRETYSDSDEENIEFDK